MASVAKWLRQWFVVPPFAGSSPVVRPLLEHRLDGIFAIKIRINTYELKILLSIGFFPSVQLSFRQLSIIFCIFIVLVFVGVLQ